MPLKVPGPTLPAFLPVSKIVSLVSVFLTCLFKSQFGDLGILRLKAWLLKLAWKELYRSFEMLPINLHLGSKYLCE